VRFQSGSRRGWNRYCRFGAAEAVRFQSWVSARLESLLPLLARLKLRASFPAGCASAKVSLPAVQGLHGVYFGFDGYPV
jgi:hypothetical protein